MLKDVRYHHVCFQDDMNMIVANQVCHKADILEFDVRDKDHAMTEEIGKVIFIIVVIIIVVIIVIIISHLSSPPCCSADCKSQVRISL